MKKVEGRCHYCNRWARLHEKLIGWVRKMVGLVYAAETWLAYREQQANRIKDLPAILDSLESKQHK